MSETMDILVRILAIVVPCLMLGVGALTGWIWMLWQDHNKHKLYVAENMLKQGALQEVKEEIHSLRDVIYRIATKMDVPVFSEPYRK
jgi:hypothetical protein